MSISRMVRSIREDLRRKITSGELPRESRLPSRRQLTKAYHVSARTISACLTGLEKEGLVARYPGSGVYVRSRPAPHTNDLNPTKDIAEIIANDLAREISSGNYRVGNALPIRKALRYQYSTSPATLTRAITKMEKRGLVHRMGRSLVVGPRESRRTSDRMRVVVIPARASADGAPLRATMRQGFTRSLEKELAHAGVRFSGRYGGFSTRKGRRFAGKMQEELGFVYPATDNWWVDKVTGNTPDLLIKELQRVSRMPGPVVIFNCTPILNRFPSFSFRQFKNVFPLGLNNMKAGEDVGNALARMGHRHIAYFSYSDQTWSDHRLQGLRKAHKAVLGNESNVQVFHARFKDHMLRRYEKASLEKVRDSLSCWGKEILNGFHFQNIDPAGDFLADLYRRADIDNYITVLKPHFERALTDKRISAWAGADHLVALSAAQFLKKREIRVPQDLSLIGFDDHPDLADRGIAAHDFQVDRMGYLAAHCILQDIPIRRDRRGIVECPGRIIERESVARV